MTSAERTELPDRCPDAEQLTALAQGALEGDARETLLSHVRGCVECTEVLRLCMPTDSGGASSDDPELDEKAKGTLAEGRLPGPGDVVANKYRVERVLGVGGMGVVVAATHLQLGRTVALKLMLPRAAASPETVARFFQEAQAAAEVQSEHVCRVLDVGTLDNGAPFIVMEFLRGSDFARLLRVHDALPVADVAGYVLQACEAIAEAHALGIVHRDLKPANLFLTMRPDGSPLVKVLDFGISKLTRSGSGSAPVQTKSLTVMGTPVYMSPEQLRSSRSVGPGTDIWSLGCILYELLARRPAFNAESAEALGALIATGDAPRIRDVRPDVPGGLDEVILRCLEKDPAARFSSIGDLAQHLAPFAPGDMGVLVGRAVRLSRPDGPLPFANTLVSDRPPGFAVTGANFARSEPEAQRNLRRLGGVVLLVAVAATAIGGFLLFRAPGVTTVSGVASTTAPASATTAPRVSPGAPVIAVDASIAAATSAAPAPSGTAPVASITVVAKPLSSGKPRGATNAPVKSATHAIPSSQTDRDSIE